MPAGANCKIWRRAARAEEQAVHTGGKVRISQDLLQVVDEIGEFQRRDTLELLRTGALEEDVFALDRIYVRREESLRLHPT